MVEDALRCHAQSSAVKMAVVSSLLKVLEQRTVATLGKGMKSRNNQEEIKVGSETTVN